MMKKSLFYILSFTWGCVLSLIGVVVCGALMLVGYRPKKYDNCYYIAVGKSWGGLEFGWFFLSDKNESPAILNHELGHGYQNIKYGPFTFVLWIIAACRYWLEQFGCSFDYYAWWYEKQANEIGNKIMEERTNENN